MPRTPAEDLIQEKVNRIADQALAMGRDSVRIRRLEATVAAAWALLDGDPLVVWPDDLREALRAPLSASQRQVADA